jgi:hypothetical protein
VAVVVVEAAAAVAAAVVAVAVDQQWHKDAVAVDVRLLLPFPFLQFYLIL